MPCPAPRVALRPHAGAGTPYQAPTPRTPSNSIKGPIVPIMSLNPYDPSWTIRAKVGCAGAGGLCWGCVLGMCAAECVLGGRTA